MGRRATYLVIASIGSLFAIQIHGCTAVGYMYGSRADHRARKSVASDSVLALTQSIHLSFGLRDGTAYSGTYAGMTYLARPDYEARYQAWREAARMGSMPSLGDSVECRSRDGSVMTGRFEGFGPGAVILRPLAGTETLHASFGQYESFAASGMEFRSDVLRAMDAAGGLPSRVVLMLATSRDTLRIASDRVATVILPAGVKYRVIGTTVGLAADVVIVAVLVAATAIWVTDQVFSDFFSPSCGSNLGMRTSPGGGVWRASDAHPPAFSPTLTR